MGASKMIYIQQNHRVISHKIRIKTCSSLSIVLMFLYFLPILLIFRNFNFLNVIGIKESTNYLTQRLEQV